MQFGYLIGQTRNALFAALDKEMLPLELNASQFVVVIGAMRNRARTVSEFCHLAGIEPGPMSRILDRLETKGIVRRVRDAQDRRQVSVTLTEKGIALHPRIHAGLYKVYGHLLKGFSEQEAPASNMRGKTSCAMREAMSVRRCQGSNPRIHQLASAHRP